MTLALRLGVLVLAAFATGAQARPGVPEHGIAMHGEPALPARAWAALASQAPASAMAPAGPPTAPSRSRQARSSHSTRQQVCWLSAPSRT